jgi:4-amino-4-deoxy-L-arabinose transferase-like glycosyltransferase
MAGVYIVAGHNYAAVRLVHCLLGVASVWLTYRIGRRAFGDSVGLLAAAAYALYPVAVMQSGDLLSEPLGVFLFLVFMELTLAFGMDGRWGHAIAAGIAFGLLLLARANCVIMVPLLLIWMLVQFRGRARLLVRALSILAVAGLVMTPWIVRNYRVFEELIPFSTMGGSALLQGNNRIVFDEPRFQGFSVWDTDLEEYRDSLRSAGNEIERDRRAKSFATDWLKQNTDKWATLAWYKFARAWNPYLKYNPSRTDRLIYVVTWGPILVLFCVGFFPTAIQSLRERSPVWLLHLAVLHYIVNSVVFFANIRYRAPVDPICIMVAAWTLHRIPHWIGRTADSLPGTGRKPVRSGV